MTDSYLELLGISKQDSPPTPHQLLGISPGEANPEIIREAAKRQLDRLRPPVRSTGASEGDVSQANPPGNESAALAPRIAELMVEILDARDALIALAAKQAANATASENPAQWWKPEDAPTAPPFPTAPADGWWVDAQATATSPPPPLSQVRTPIMPAPSVQACDPESVLPPAPPPTWWADEAKETPAPKPAAVPGWWQDSVAEAGIIPPAPVNHLPAAGANPSGVGAPTPPATVAAPGGWTGVTTSPPAAPAVPGWWKDSAPQPNSPVPPMQPSGPIAGAMPPVIPVAHAPPAAPTPSYPTAPHVLELDEDDDYPKRRRRPTQSSPLPWIILTLLVVAGGVGFGVWYVNQKPATSSATEVAAKPSDFEKTGTTLQETRLKPFVKKIETPPKKAVSDPINKDPMTLEGDPATPIDPEPPKKEVERKPLEKKQEFTEPVVYRVSKGTVLGVGLTDDAKTFLTTSTEKDVVLCSLADSRHTVIHQTLAEGVAATICNGDKLGVFCDGFQIFVYDLAKKNVLVMFENPSGGGGIECLAAPPDGKFVLTGSTDGRVRMWSIADKKLQHTLDVSAKSQVTAVAVSPDGAFAAIGLADGQVSLWNLTATPRIVRNWKAHGGRVTVLAYAPDGKRFASFGADSLGQVWEAVNGSPVSKLKGHQGPILGAAWCADSRHIVSAGVDQKVHLWTAPTGEMHEWSASTREKIYCLAVDSHDRFVLVGQSEGIVQLFPLPSPFAPKE